MEADVFTIHCIYKKAYNILDKGAMLASDTVINGILIKKGFHYSTIDLKKCFTLNVD